MKSGRAVFGHDDIMPKSRTAKIDPQFHIIAAWYMTINRDFGPVSVKHLSTINIRLFVQSQ